MAKRDVGHVREYLRLITEKRGGLEGQIAELERIADSQEKPFSGLEANVGRLTGRLGLAPLASAGPVDAPVGVMDAAPDLATVARAGIDGMKRLAAGKEPSVEELSSMEAIIDAEIRPAIDIIDNSFQVTHPLWTHLSRDSKIRGRIEAAIPSVGRIELPGHPALPYAGTGFLVDDGLIMTNRHVAEIFASGLGDRRLAFITGRAAGIDFLQERGGSAGPMLEVRGIVMIHPYWDMAVLAVDGVPAARKPLKLSLKDARDLDGHQIFIIGYPAFDGRNPPKEQNDLFDHLFGVKRLQPGELKGGMRTGSFGKMVPAATHDCSTLGGNSGSAVFDMATGEVLALHFGGLYHQRNYAVPTFELAHDSRVIDAGVGFAGKAPGGPNEWGDWWSRADAGEAPQPGSPAATARGDGTAQPAAPAGRPAVVSPGTASGGDCCVSFEIPLRITVSLGASAPVVTAPAGSGRASVADDGTEAMREPVHDSDYRTRNGYDPDFLRGKGGRLPSVPMPVAATPGVLARTRTGGDTLHYQNFSIRVHKARRLALVTASNVTREPRLRRPDPNQSYTRDALGGLGRNDRERWFLDPRMEAQYQIPDAFFTKDRGAFDKGHLVRRDDVAWGATYETLRRANGDSYHVTNCSPQVAGFNQSSRGVNNWGDLEDRVLSEAASERLCVLAGPVLDPADEVFLGVGDGGTPLRVKIPARFWKVIVARVDEGLAAFGFVLEQSLADVAFEFAVPPEFVPAMYPLRDIQTMAGVVFHDAVLDADQYDTIRGGEIVRLSGVHRKQAGRPGGQPAPGTG